MPDRPELVVFGEGVAESAPDGCVLDVALNVMAGDGPEALRQCAALVDRVTRALAGAAVGPDDMRTVGLALHDWIDQQTRQVTARVATTSLQATVRPLAAAGDALAALADTAGPSLQVRGLRLVVDDSEPLRRAARRRAVEDARRKAAELAAAAGVGLGPLVHLAEGWSSRPPGRFGAARAGNAGPTDGSQPIVPGTLEVRAHVTVTYALD